MREGKRAVRRKNLERALNAFAAEDYIDQFVDTLRMRAKSNLGRPKEPKKRIRAIYIPDKIRGPRIAADPKLQKQAREVAAASRVREVKHY